ncbi:DUF1289 domain-containing protein [Paracoccus fistulariae]|nr:DUF1289 domain-containing protein [Paracoccus fistulariae]MDB6182304.1 DUF1289 domain-containing protein [Paracoccus fistulariae]
MIQSPCINICVMDKQQDLCVGCYRSLAEIADWGGMTPAERQAIMAQLPGRRQALKDRRRRDRARD